MSHDNSETDELVYALPPWMPKNPDSGNYKLLAPIGDKIEEYDEDVTAVDRATTVQHADTIDQLIELAKLVDLVPKTSEGKEKYRARVLAEFQLSTNEGTPPQIIQNTATILDIDPEKVDYDELSEPGVIQLKLPGDALDALSITNAELSSIIDRLVGAGVRVESIVKGTFTYISETDYNDVGFTHDVTNGYDGLDSNGYPKDNGGTYAGLIS